MLFNYQYVSHDIEKLQAWLDHLVKEVWCRAGGEYSLNLLHPDLKAVIEDIANSDRIKADYLDGPIRTIDNIFQQVLSDSQRAQVSQWHDNNNDIEALCGNEPLKGPVTYSELGAINADLESALKPFCKSLFTDVMHLKCVTSRAADIDSHYQAFVTVNGQGKCPYCGYGDIKGNDHSTREAYDHFLPKDTYPFNSVNFKNLAPMCHECNSSYKLQRDPLRHIDPVRKRGAGTRRRAFYSYAAASPGITIELALPSKAFEQVVPDDIILTVRAPGREEEVESWMDVFGIEERFKAKCCGKNDGKFWLTQAVDECQNVGISAHEVIQKVQRYARSYPWAEANFLKAPFLEACQAAALIR